MKLFTLLTAAASLLIVSACASTPVPTDERVKVETPADANIQPGIIYVSPKAANVFTLRDVETEINESGYLAVRVFGKTAELSALKWAFFGDVDYEFGYQFLWFDADGNRTASDVGRLRSTIPGDPVRFVGHAPAEECRNYALILQMASEFKGVAAGSAKSDEEAVEAAEKDAETQATEDEETGKDEKTILPALPEENVSGDKNDVKVIGVPSAVPAAEAAE